MKADEKIKETKFNSIIKLIEDGSSLRYSLSSVAMSSRTFYELIDGNKDKQKQYTRACAIRHDKIFEEIIEIADKQGEDVIIIKDEQVVNHNVINRNRLQIDARKWMLSKMNPKKYGDKTEVEHSGEIKGNDPKINLIVDGKSFNLKE